ncbi:MAG TPA: CHAP domain-containing protein [Rhizomicrobium sp.]|nr:CHAP domain-containing protein [Rhizomicrobium sp.]
MNAGSFVRMAAVVCACALLGACGSFGTTELSAIDLAYAHANRGTTPAYPQTDPRMFPDDDASSAPSAVPAGLECVPYAREHSGIDIHGDAYTWWDKASGVYARGSDPLVGSVMVLVNYAGRHHAHVAVVRRLISPREIRIDHANWLNDGAIYVNDPVIDVSDANDWSQIKVWNIRTGSWGTKVYTVRGFIGPGPANPNPAVASYAPRPGDSIAQQIAASSMPAAYRTPAPHPPLGDGLLNDPR